LFCGGGGASVGYARAGFEVVGVDINRQPNYPFPFYQEDAMTFPLDGFDVIHASPPCQHYSSMTTRWTTSGGTSEHPDLVAATRRRLLAVNVPYVMENVVGSPLHDYAMLCGSMFGLGSDGGYLKRHRWFESNVWIWPPHPCAHVGPAVGVWGHAGGSSKRDPHKRFFNSANWREAMGIDWMTSEELVEAIPPAYTEYIGQILRKSLNE